MGLIRETSTHEYHEVQCAECKRAETISVPLHGLNDDPRFTADHCYQCAACRGFLHEVKVEPAESSAAQLPLAASPTVATEQHSLF